MNFSGSKLQFLRITPHNSVLLRITPCDLVTATGNNSVQYLIKENVSRELRVLRVLRMRSACNLRDALRMQPSRTYLAFSRSDLYYYIAVHGVSNTLSHLLGDTLFSDL